MLAQLIFLIAIMVEVCNTMSIDVKEFDDGDSVETPARSTNRQTKRNDIKKETPPSALLTFISKVLGTVDQRCKMAVGRAKKSVDGFRRLSEDVEEQLNRFLKAKL